MLLEEIGRKNAGLDVRRFKLESLLQQLGDLLPQFSHVKLKQLDCQDHF